MSTMDATFLPRISTLLKNVADEYAGLAESEFTPESTAALSVVEDIAGSTRLALENFRTGQYSRAMKRLNEAECAYKDMPCLILKHIENEANDKMVMRFVDSTIAGRLGAW